MARRSIVPADISAAQRKATNSLLALMSRYNVAEFRAQSHASDMIDVLAGFALDPTVPISMRRDCAKDVLAEAYGRPGERLSAPAQVAPGSPEAQETERAIDAIQRTSKQLEQLQAFVGAGVPYEQWPDEIKAIAGEFGAVWAEGTPEQEGQVGHAD